MTVTYHEPAMATIQEQAEKDAERILQNLWGGYRFPVDPVRLARALGINVVDAYLDGDVAGALVKESNRDPVILVNGSDSPNRKRFTIAHEIGHFIRHDEDELEYVDRRDTLSATGVDAEEMYANAFAANLLMPKDQVRRLAKDGFSTAEMAARFGVSRDAMNVRMKVLGVTPKQ